MCSSGGTSCEDFNRSTHFILLCCEHSSRDCFVSRCRTSLFFFQVDLGIDKKVQRKAILKAFNLFSGSIGVLCADCISGLIVVCLVQITRVANACSFNDVDEETATKGCVKVAKTTCKDIK